MDRASAHSPTHDRCSFADAEAAHQFLMRCRRKKRWCEASLVSGTQHGVIEGAYPVCLFPKLPDVFGPTTPIALESVSVPIRWHPYQSLFSIRIIKDQIGPIGWASNQ